MTDLFAASAEIMMNGGGGGSSETMYDRISKLPTVFSFDIADGWRCELCADSEPIGITPEQVMCRSDKWREGYSITIMPEVPKKVYYLRIFYNSELKLMADIQRKEAYYEYYECSDTGVHVGELKKTSSTEYSDFRIGSVAQYAANNLPYPPAVNLNCTFTETENGEITSVKESGFSVIGTNLKYFGNVDPNTYADFVKAVRKMSDEYNKITE